MTRRRRLAVALAGLAAAAAAAAAPAAAHVLQVGPGQRFAKPCQAIAAARPGDTVAIDARGNGTYDGDVCAWSTDRLHVVGVHGRARIDAAGRLAQGKGIWVISGADTVIDRVELSGAHSAADRNGAGIRQQGPDLTVRRSFFHDDDDGLLIDADPTSDVLVEATELARDGAGDGYSHNIYVGHVHRFTMRWSWSHDARVGHLVKSRADITDLRYNRLTGEGGTDSYEIDVPDGGRATIVGNVIEQGRASESSIMVSYGEESLANPHPALDVVGNTFVNDLGRGPAIHVAAGAPRAVVRDDLSTGSSTLVDQPGAITSGDCVTARPRFVAPARHDYHLRAGSPCVDAGRRLRGPLAPRQEYVERLRHRRRTTTGRAPDAGAFERR